MSLLEVEDLSITYRTSGGPVPAVRGVSLSIDRGETVGIAGESGCGKSTLAGAILRLLPPSTRIDGRISLDGEDVDSMKPGRLRAVRWTSAAIVFQGALHSLNPVQRVGNQIGEAIEIHDDAVAAADVRRRVGDLLEQVGLPRVRGRDFPHQLSGGQRQRVLIAMALACNPQLLIADEPTTALDVMVQAQVLRLLEDLQRDRGLALMFITHDLSVLTTTCQRLVVMYAGRVVEDGPSSNVVGDAAHPYTRALAAAFPTIGDPSSRMRPSGLGGDPPDPNDMPTGCSFHPRCALATEECRAVDVELRPVALGRVAACLHTGARHG
jgi:peptide/nickel transport system ATP-binding protein